MRGSCRHQAPAEITMVDAHAAVPHPNVRSTVDELSSRHPRFSDRVVGAFADTISRRVTPGAMLPTKPQLCDRFGGRRTIVREAIAPAAAGG